MAARSVTNCIVSTPSGAPMLRIRSTSGGGGSSAGPSANPVSSASETIDGAYRTGVPDNPIAAAALDLLLDATASVDVVVGLIVESATYSLLQAGPEHQ